MGVNQRVSTSALLRTAKNTGWEVFTFKAFFKDMGSKSAKINALSRSLATLEFNLEGFIVDVNANFLALTGYNRQELIGKHRSIFVDVQTAAGPDYTKLWKDLAVGRSQTAEHNWFGKEGRKIWIRAIYTPIPGRDGKPARILKFAMDVSQRDHEAARLAGQFTAIEKNYGVIYFGMDGTILEANQSFLDALGYQLEEIRGRHHSIFVPPDVAKSLEYRNFWNGLREGTCQTAQVRRYGKAGREVWLQAAYNPILDAEGKVYRVVKFATDITEDKKRSLVSSGELAAINRSQCIIHFDMDGHILEANDNFLHALGYRAEEIVGRHHRMFVEASYSNSQDYRQFWKSLRDGNFHSARFCRLDSRGRHVWIQATYNPIRDFDGKPCKVVKYATDITAEVDARRSATDAANKAADNVQMVADAALEMSTVFDNINADMAASRDHVNAAYRHANDAGARTSELRLAAESMDDIVQSISKIAERINLLSLNATIEAARAGESGRGFAAVASEIKNLATRAAKATKTISEQISRMQIVADKVVLAVGGITNVIESVQATVGRTAIAMEVQSQTTWEISKNMATAAHAVADVGSSLKAMS